MTGQKKILILANEMYPKICVGGLGKFITGISRGLVANGWEVKIFIDDGKPVYLPFWLPENKKRSQQLAKKALKWCFQYSWWPDWVWVQDWEGVYQSEIIKDKFKIIWTIHSPIETKTSSYGYGYIEEGGHYEPVNWGKDFFDFSNFIQKGIANADVITTVSPTYARNLKRLLYFEKATEILGISNGIDFHDWQAAKDPYLGFKRTTNWREFKKVNKFLLQLKFNLLTGEVPVFAFVSRLVDQKGVDLLLKVLPKFLAQNDLQFIILGNGSKKYSQMLLGLQLFFPNKLGLCLQSDFSLPHQIFAGADFLVLPSASEPFGIVVAEARQYGVVPIIRGVDGLKDQVKDGLNGLSFINPCHFADKLNQALKVFKTNWWWQNSQNSRFLVNDWSKVALEYDRYLFEANQKGKTADRRIEKTLFFN